MIILVEGKPALLKSGSSFEFIAENRLFMGRDSYTLTLTFPLRDCSQNRAIFGNLERIDVDKEKIFYECEIRDKSFSSIGSLLITGVSQTEVKCQFAEGRCEQTATDPFENKYINALDLGIQPSSGNYTPEQAWAGIGYGKSEVALPWINEQSPTAFNNWVVFKDNTYKWEKNIYVNRQQTTDYQTSVNGSSLSWQPYLIVIAKRICEAVGYSYDFTEWENSDYKFLIICNTLPYTWTEGDLRNYKSILPRWTVTEFFEKLELLLMCEFDINHKAKHVKFVFSKTAISNVAPFQIQEVVDEYDVDISTEQQSCDYIGAKRLAFKECVHSMQSYYACDWFIEGQYCKKDYPNINALIEANKRHALIASDGAQYPAYGDGASLSEGGTRVVPSIWDAINHIMYAINEDTYFVFRSIGIHKDAPGRRGGASQMYVLQPINIFGSGSEESDDVDTEEIEFVPVCVSDTHVSDDDDKGYMMFLSFSTYEEESTRDSTTDEKIYQPLPAATIEAGKKEEKTEYYDVIYIGFWDGTIPNYGKTPYPMLDSVNVTQDWTYFSNHLPDLRLTGQHRNIQLQIPSINPKQKFKVSFISDTIPNPRAIFYIRGKKFLCEKITATFTDDGMSQMLKGEFYPIV
ncbi:MAG: hypothetical protein K2M07_08445 [Muribaculaceae bacterium]|nr:hypothetical protein [Muribaculaceae bacterium]